MDPNIVKFLEEDEDETLHSGADVEAFTAELNRDIEGNSSASQQPSDSVGALPHGGSQTTGQLTSQWQISGHDGIANFQTGQDLMEVDENARQGSESENKKGDAESTQDHNDMPNPPLDAENNFPVSQPVNTKPSGEQSNNIQESDSKPNPEGESQPQESHNLGNCSVSSNDQQPSSMGFEDQQFLSTGKANQPTSSGVNNEQVTSTANQHTAGMGMSSQPAITSGMSHQSAMTSGMSNQQAMTSGMSSQPPAMITGMSSQQTMALGMSNQQVMTLGMSNQQAMNLGMSNQLAMTSGMTNQPGMTSGINNQQAMTSGMNNQQAVTSGMSNQPPAMSTSQQPGSSLKLNKQVPFGMLLPIIQPQLDKDRAMQLHTLYLKLKKNEISKDGFVRLMRSIVGDQMLKMAVYKLQTQATRTSHTAPNQFQPPPQAPGRQHVLSDMSNSTNDSSMAKSHEVEGLTDMQGVQLSQTSTSTSGALSQDRNHPSFSSQGFNKQQHLQFSQASFPTYGSGGGSYSSFSASSLSVRSQPHDSQMRQAPTHQNTSANLLGPTNMMNLSKFDRPNSLNDPKKMQAASLQQNQVQWPSAANKEQKIGVSPSAAHVKQEPVDQSNEHKALMSSSHGLPSAPIKQGSAAPGNFKDESFEMQSSRTGFSPATLVPSNPASSSITSQMEANTLSRLSSLTSVGPGNNSKALPKKPLVGQKKPMETPVSSPPSSKKQKVSGAFSDQSIEHLNDVTAVSGVNLREEEEQLLSGSKEDSRVSEASRRVVQEEEERLILLKIPLRKKVLEIMTKCGLKNLSSDVERCLSLCVEERMRGLISNLIRLSKQRVDLEKPRHRTIITSDVKQQIMAINRKAREEWEKKQTETEKSQKLNEPESGMGVDGDKEKDENRARSTKANKEEDDKMRTTAANVAVRAATGVGDMLSRWQLMIEAKQKHGGSDTVSSSHPGKEVTRKSSSTSARNTRENQEAEKRDSSTAFSTPASIRKVGRNQVVARVARSISIKDVVAILEREPQMSKSTMIYRLYNKVGAADALAE